MTRVLVFPGQGSQAVAMGKALYDALGEKLSGVIFNGPDEHSCSPPIPSPL